MVLFIAESEPKERLIAPEVERQIPGSAICASGGTGENRTKLIHVVGKHPWNMMPPFIPSLASDAAY
jgi:hypothetical protein